MTGSGVELVHDRVNVIDVAGRAHEGERHHVDVVLQRPAQVGGVLLGECRDADRNTGQVDALVVADASADDDLGDHVVLGHLKGLEFDRPIVDQDLVARLHVMGQRVQRRSGTLFGAFDALIGRDREAVTGREHLFAIDKGLQADLGALQVGEDADRGVRLPSAASRTAFSRDRCVSWSP